MNKIYLNQYAIIVLSLVLLFLFANNANLLYVLYNLTLTQPGVSEDTGFKLKFYETIFTTVVYLTSSLYFALMAVMKFPVIEFGKEKSSKKDEE